MVHRKRYAGAIGVSIGTVAHRIGAERGESLNSTVLRLLRDAVGLDARRDRLRGYIGWTSDDLEEFSAALRAQRVVDEQYWR